MFQVTTFGYTINELTVTPTGVNATFYQGNGEWNLEGHSSKGSYNGDYTFVSYSCTVKESPVYFCIFVCTVEAASVEWNIL